MKRHATRFAPVLSLQPAHDGQLADRVSPTSGHRDDGDPTLGFYRFDVTDAGITHTFIPLARESQSTAGYGPGAHPKPGERDYSLAWEKEGK